MPYHTILVSLNEVDRVSALLDVAIPIAKNNQAHIVGLHVIPAIDIPPTVVALEIPKEILEAHEENNKKRADEIKSLFEETTERHGMSGEWRCVSSLTTQVAQHVIVHGRCSDLIVVDQCGNEQAKSDYADLPQELLMESGRPVLIVPNERKFESFGDYPLIAWDASHEAARAAFDAIPLLKNAKEVKLVWINPENYIGHNVEIAGSAIATSLARHGIKIEAAHSTSGGGIGDALDKQLLDTGADFLVMGGYGHSRLREYVFGGATRHVLKNMKIPVLMSH